MPRVESNDPDRMVYRTGGGCLVLFGLPFFLAGLFVMASPFLAEELRPKDSKSGKPMPVALAVVMGGAFAALGAGLMFGRGGKELDRRTDSLTAWWGLLVPFSRKTYCLSDFERVALSREVRRSKNSTYTVFPVRVHGPGGVKVTLEEPRDANAARALAEEVAKFLSRPLADTSLGTEVVRQPGELDESVRARTRRTGERPAVPLPPAGQRCRTRVVADTLCVEMPPRGVSTRHAVFGVLAAGIAAFFLLAMVLPIALDERMPGGVKAFAIAFIGFLFIAVPLLLALWSAARAARLRKAVEVSPRELRVITHSVLRDRTVVIPCDELEELAIVPVGTVPGALAGRGEAILARSDRATACFGEGLSHDELLWLRAVIWNVASA